MASATLTRWLKRSWRGWVVHRLRRGVKAGLGRLKTGPRVGPGETLGNRGSPEPEIIAPTCPRPRFARRGQALRNSLDKRRQAACGPACPFDCAGEICKPRSCVKSSARFLSRCAQNGCNFARVGRFWRNDTRSATCWVSTERWSARASAASRASALPRATVRPHAVVSKHRGRSAWPSSSH